MHRAARRLSLLALLLIAASTAPAHAESPIYTDVWPPPNINQYWEGSLPNEPLQGVSTDTVIPLSLRLIGDPRPTLEADPLSFITVSVKPQADPAAASIPGKLTPSLSSDRGRAPSLILWSPIEPLAPLTTYDVTVTVDNTGLRDGGDLIAPDLRSSFQMTTAEGVLAAQPVDLGEPTVSYVTFGDWLSCPYGQAACRDEPISEDGFGDAGCYSSVPFLWSQPNIALTWRDGDPTDGDLFFTYIIAAANGSFLPPIANEDVLMSAHSAPYAPSFWELSQAQAPQYCFTFTTTDLRTIAAGAAAPQTSTFCVSLADMPPLPEPAVILAECAPYDFPVGDVGAPDTSSNSGESDPGDESGCGCTTTRAPQGQPPVGLLFGLAATFGAGAVLRRRVRA